MRIYYDTQQNELLTEEEVYRKIDEEIERNNYHLDYLASIENMCELWDMLTQTAKKNIIAELRKEMIEEDYITRDFEEERR